jgi:hypothetical protein
VNWLLHRLRPRSAGDWFRLLTVLAVVAFLAATAASWDRSRRGRESLKNTPMGAYGVPVPPNTYFVREPAAPFASPERGTPSAVWTSEQADLGLDYLRLWYRKALNQNGWVVQVLATRPGDVNVDSVVSHSPSRKAVVEVRLSRADTAGQRTRIIVLYYPQAGNVEPGRELPADLGGPGG